MASRTRNKRRLDKDEISSAKVVSEVNSFGNSNGTLIGPASKKDRGGKGIPLSGSPAPSSSDPSLPTSEESNLLTVKQEPQHLPGGEDQEDSTYEILSTNEFHGVDPVAIKAKEDSWCSCQAPEGKGEIVCLQNCDNRAKRIECSVMLCRAGEQCGNRAVQLQTQPLLAVNQAGAVVVTHDLEAGSFIGQYTGQVMTRDKFEEILNNEYVLSQNLRLHVLPLSVDLVVDATAKGSICRLASHSCAPNAEINVWKVEGVDCLAMYCVKDVNVNDVITFDHSAEIEYLGTSKRCTCGSNNCKKILGRQAHARGPLKCGACQVSILSQGAVGEVHLHPDLSTPLCKGCHDGYCGQDWSSGGQGQCRWCCKPGKNLTCSACGKQFCKTCLKNNLGPSYIKLAEHGAWTCLCCDSRPLDRIRSQLWVSGEQEKGSSLPTKMTTQPRMTRPTSSPASLASRLPTVRPGLQTRAPGVRQIRPATPRTRGPAPRGQTPRGGARVGNPFPVRMLGQSSVSIERVPRPAAPRPKVAQQKTQHTAAIINQLQRYSGLSIQPVSESASQLENVIKDVEQVYRVLQEACNEARKISRDAGLGKAKEKLSDGIRQAKSKLSDAESKL